MPELSIVTEEDLKKLEGWQIRKAEPFPPESPIPGFILEMTHQAASVPVRLIIHAHVQMVLSGNSVTAIPQMTFQSEDIS